MIKDKFNLIKIKQRNKSLLKVLLSYDIIRKNLLLKNLTKWKQNDYKLKKKLLLILNENKRLFKERNFMAAFIVSNRIYSYVIRLKYLDILNSRESLALNEVYIYIYIYIYI
jgi:hypothetical protein